MEQNYPDKSLKPITLEGGRCDMERMLTAQEMPREPYEEACGRTKKTIYSPKYPSIQVHSRAINKGTRNSNTQLYFHAHRNLEDLVPRT
jgi:hypothetical protein